MGLGGVIGVRPAGFQTSVEELRLSPTTPVAAGETNHTLLDVPWYIELMERPIRRAKPLVIIFRPEYMVQWADYSPRV